MSWQATLWAANLPHSRVGHLPFRVLMLLADHAHDDGSGAWRSVQGIAATLDVSQRQVYRALRDLKNERLIVEGDQHMVDHLPSNKRPRVYNLVLTSPVTVQLELLTGVTNLSPLTSDVSSLEEEPPVNTSKTSRGNYRERVTPKCPHGHSMIDDRHCEFGCLLSVAS